MINNVIMEVKFESYSGANVSKLFDDDLETCEDLQNYWTYLPMTTIRTEKHRSGNFTVTVNVKSEIQAIAQKTVSVFVSHAGLTSNDYYQTQEIFYICTRKNTLSFGCYCPTSCNVYIRFRFKNMQDTAGIMYTVCEIDIV